MEPAGCPNTNRAPFLYGIGSPRFLRQENSAKLFFTKRFCGCADVWPTRAPPAYARHFVSFFHFFFSSSSHSYRRLHRRRYANVNNKSICRTKEKNNRLQPNTCFSFALLFRKNSSGIADAMRKPIKHKNEERKGKQKTAFSDKGVFGFRCSEGLYIGCAFAFAIILLRTTECGGVFYSGVCAASSIQRDIL